MIFNIDIIDSQLVAASCVDQINVSILSKFRLLFNNRIFLIHFIRLQAEP